MRIWPDCIPCIEKMAIGICRNVLKDEKKIKKCMTDILKLPPLRGEQWDLISPLVLRDVWRMILEHSKLSDPMSEIKAEQNRKALEMYPLAKEMVLKSDEPFLNALKLAIAGNELDAMVSVAGEETRDMLKMAESFTLDRKSVDELKRRLENAETIAYFIDNCGEIVFDKLFIEILTSVRKCDVTVVTRTVPILNDATFKDAQSVGLQEVARLIENGTPEPIAGTIFSQVSPEVRTLIVESDLLIAKGVGNYDALTEEIWLKGRLTMLYYGKCHPCCSATHARIGELIVYNF